MVAARNYIGPRSKAVTSCFPCEFLTHRNGQSYCRHEPMNGAHIGRTGGTYETPPDCPLLPAARLALLVDLARTVCRKCGRTVEKARECYAIPTCFACLPPPPPLPVHTFGTIEEPAIRTMMLGDMLSEPTATPGEHVTVELGDGGWLVRLGTGDASLAGNSKLTMRHVEDRRKRASAATTGAPS